MPRAPNPTYGIALTRRSGEYFHTLRAVVRTGLWECAPESGQSDGTQTRRYGFAMHLPMAG